MHEHFKWHVVMLCNLTTNHSLSVKIGGKLAGLLCSYSKEEERKNFTSRIRIWQVIRHFDFEYFVFAVNITNMICIHCNVLVHSFEIFKTVNKMCCSKKFPLNFCEVSNYRWFNGGLSTGLLWNIPSNFDLSVW